MAESKRYPTIATVPGMVTLQNKETGEQSNHFPVDVKEILTVNAGKFEIVKNGAAEQARLTMTPLDTHARNVDRSLVKTEVSGVDGLVMMASSPEELEEFRKWQASKNGMVGMEAPGSAPPAGGMSAPKGDPEADKKVNESAAKAGTTAAAQKAEAAKSDGK